MNLEFSQLAKNSAESNTLSTSRVMQRKCACGNHITANEKCGSCHKEYNKVSSTPVQRQKNEGAAEDRTGMPGSLRSGLEALSGMDLSGIRVHKNSSKPSQVNALAYTQGSDIHLGRGQEHHLPHEGWHAVQQMQGRVTATMQAKGVSINDDAGLEREADVMGAKALRMKGTEQATMGSAHKEPTSLHRETETKSESDVLGEAHEASQREVPLQLQSVTDDSCPPYERDEVQKSRTSAGHLDTDIWQLGGNKLLVADFGVDRRSVKASTASEPTLRSWLAEFESDPSYRNFDIKGYDDCRGTAERHLHLRKGRAKRVHDLLAPSAKSRVESVAAAPAGTYVAGNLSIGARAQNRGVVIKYVRDTNIEFPDEDGEHIKIPKFKCGPDVTSQVEDAVSLTQSRFAVWSSGEKTEACEALRAVTSGRKAWDIVELHNNAWIYLKYRPFCATKGARPKCGSSIEVSNQCYYAGSPNYVIFGTMCKLCHDHFRDIGRAGSTPGYTGWMDFTVKSMTSLIDLYKTSSDNVGSSKAWSRAGYAGWPGGGSPPLGDRQNCLPVCSKEYDGTGFRVNWYPHMFHTGR